MDHIEYKVSKRNGKSFLKTSVFYSLFHIILVSFIALSNFLITKTNTAYDFENLLNLNFKGALFLFGIMASSLFVFNALFFFFGKVKKQKLHFFIRLFLYLVSGALIFGFYQFLTGYEIPWIPSILSYLTLFLLSDIFLFEREQNLSWLMSWIIVLAGFSSILIYHFYLKYDLSQRVALAKSLVHEPDSDQVKEIQNFSASLDSDISLNQLLDVPYPFKIHKDEFLFILQKHLLEIDLKPEQASVILNVYDTYGNAIVHDQFTPKAYYLSQIQHSSKLQADTYFNPVENLYILRKEIAILNHPNSPFELYIEWPQNNGPPEALLAYTFSNETRKNEYAVYKNGILQTSMGYGLPQKINEQEIKLAEKEYQLDRSEDFSYLHFQKDAETRVLLKRKLARLIKPVSLFSLLFSILGILMLILALINSYITKLPSPLDFSLNDRSGLRNRLQYSLIFFIVFSFIIIGIVTIFYFSFLTKDFNENIVTQKIVAIAADVESRIQHLDVEEEIVRTIETSVYDLSNTHQTDIHFYSPFGKIINSSAPKLFEFGKFPLALAEKEIAQLRDEQATYELRSENLGKLNYQSIFLPIQFENKKIGYLNLAFSKETKSQNSVTDFVGTLLNVYVFLFLLAGSIALILSRSITKPLAVLATKLKETKLGKKNEIIEWEANDELGELIRNYNEMVSKLEESAQFLAKTERDGAWREMAKQVAHEIKNPLTPMKLSIQYLQRAIQSNPEEADELIKRVSNTLIEQIENLSQIATEFSNFGTMPSANNQKVVLNEVLENIHDLFRKREDMDIHMSEPIDDLVVYADKNHLIRILNNIVKNAIQSIPSDRRGNINIHLFKEGNKAIIKISDNGSGIPEHMKDKVFTPNFTTKSSGSGLGLAISANMIESFGGEIFFETRIDEGTDFIVEIPLMRLEDNFQDIQRVKLED